MGPTVGRQIVPGALFGVKGFYSFVANFSPELALALWDACERGDWEAAAKLRMRIDGFFRAGRPKFDGVSASPALGKIATAAGVSARCATLGSAGGQTPDLAGARQPGPSTPTEFLKEQHET